MAQFVYDQDEWMKRIAENIVKGYRDLSRDDQKVIENYKKIRRKQTVDMKKANLSESSEENINLEEFAINKDYNFEDITTLRKFKHAMKTKAGVNLCTNAIKVALIDLEDKIASVLLVEYQVKLEREMITRALITDKFDFLHNMWKFQKNYVEENGKKVYITFDVLFKRILTV